MYVTLTRTVQGKSYNKIQIFKNVVKVQEKKSKLFPRQNFKLVLINLYQQLTTGLRFNSQKNIQFRN